ncbi:MAG: DNA repair exonuclease [Armatimonadetes bacterium]|nr:DNA repair exonuclease [Armatimonadota bacterium]
MKLIHTADVHLDAPNATLGERAAELRRTVRETFTRVVDMCLERDAQVFIIAGDLFDSRTPPRATVDFALSQLERLGRTAPPVHVFLLPGTHDCWAEGAIYDTTRMRSLPDHIHILGGTEPASVVLPHLDLAVHGAAHQCGIGGQRPLRRLKADAGVAFNVGVAHGSYERGDIEDDDSLFSEDDIAASGMDYLALGHWHSWNDYTSGGVVAVNPGSPEVPGFGKWSAGAVAEVTLGEGPVHLEKLVVGRLSSGELEVDAGTLAGAGDLAAQLRERADPHLLLDVKLTGLAAPGVVLDLEETIEELAGEFFALRVQDRSHPALDDVTLREAPASLVLGRFIQLARDRIDNAPDDRERRVAEQALQLGVALLRGQEVL